MTSNFKYIYDLKVVDEQTRRLWKTNAASALLNMTEEQYKQSAPAIRQLAARYNVLQWVDDTYNYYSRLKQMQQDGKYQPIDKLS